jgi:SAM-dependent methyltransferase
MPELFTRDSPFVREDNRRTRPNLPTSAASLNRRHGLLMPPRTIEGSSVLDLGCCIGATGHWALELGARRYVGVEHQPGYAKQAGRLLAGRRNATIVPEDAARYAARGRRSFDLVAMLGVAHGLYDPLAFIRDAAARARRYFCFEDFGERTRSAALVAAPWTPMPVAGRRASTVGFGWMLSPSAVGALMKFLGFRPDMRAVFIARNRWLCRYVRTGAPSLPSAYARDWIRWTG